MHCQRGLNTYPACGPERNVVRRPRPAVSWLPGARRMMATRRFTAHSFITDPINRPHPDRLSRCPARLPDPPSRLAWLLPRRARAVVTGSGLPVIDLYAL